MDLKENEIDETLLLKYLNGTAKSEEQSRVDAWLAEEPANNETLLQMARIYHAQRTRLRIGERNTVHAWGRMNQRMKQRVRRIVFYRIAVVASILFGFWGTGSLVWKNQQVDPLPQMITINTNAGMRSQLTLPDSSVVFLNAGSTLTYPSQFDKNERRVQLSGEAYFKVAHNKRRPFVVSVADNKMNIQVLGTAFNLQAYEQDSLAQIALIEGRVQVGIQGQNGNIPLTPSNMITYDMKTGKVFTKKINAAQETGWMDGRLIFKDTPIPEVLRRLSHFYSVDFDVPDTVIKGYTFTGAFENRPLFQILDYLKISSKIEYSMLYPENQAISKPVIRLNKERSKK